MGWFWGESPWLTKGAGIVEMDIIGVEGAKELGDQGVLKNHPYMYNEGRAWGKKMTKPGA